RALTERGLSRRPALSHAPPPPPRPAPSTNLPEGELITCHRPLTRIQPSRTDDWWQDSSSALRPLAASFLPSSVCLRPAALAVGDENRSSDRARWPIPLPTG